MSRAGRIVAVTAGLTGAGAVVGTLAGGLALAVSFWLTEKVWMWGSFYLAAWVGAPLGAVTAPLLSWLLLRRVSLGRMFAACAAGTIVGGVTGWVTIPKGGDEVTSGLGGALIGCMVAAVLLRHRLEA